MKNALRVLLVAVIFVLIGSFVATILLGREKTILFLVGDISKIDKILTILSATKFLVLQVLILAAAVGCGFLLLFGDHIIVFLNSISIFIERNIAMLMNELRFTEIKWLLIFPVVSSVFFAIVMPVSYDEAYTYLQFTSKSILVSLSYYPAPNNHVLHSMITNITRYIPFLPVLFCLRIFSLIVSFFTWLLCYSFIKKYYSKQVALVVVGVASMLFMSIYYSYMSRGYGLVSFFFVLSFYASYNIIFNKDAKKYWLLFSVSNVLGFFTMPSYLYVFIMMNAIILWNNKLQLKNQFIYNVLTTVVVIVLYLPIIVVNGLEALTSNRFVIPISREEVVGQLIGFFKNTLTEIVGVNYMFICVLLILSLFMLIKFKMKFELKTFVVFIVCPFLLLIAHSVIPFPRTFNYYSIVLVFLVCIPYWKIIQDISVKYVIGVVVLIQCILFLNFYLNVKKYESFNISYSEINNKIIGNGSYFFSANLFEVNFLFENKIHGYTMSKATYNFPPVKVDLDTMAGYDYYIIDKRYDFTKSKKAIYSDGQTNVYSK